jgi:aldoxime dehydratase
MSDVSELEPAIPEHLRVERTRPLGAPEDFVPEAWSYSSRFDPSVKTLPFVYFGVQHCGHPVEAEAAISRLKAGLSEENGPAFWDRATYVDGQGYTNTIIVGYWSNLDTYRAWEDERAADWWHAGADLNGPLGLFREAYTPGIEDTETTFGHRYPEGYSHLAGHWSEPTDTHGYWGSARDRMPRSQTDPFEPSGKPVSSLKAGEDSLGRHVVVTPHENLCLLRSGQDWSETEDDERAFYLERVEPLLNKGMLEIRNEGLNKGCYYNRYMTVTDESGAPFEKSYSLSAWHSISEIEQWVRQATHLAIFHIGVKHFEKIGPEAKLRLYHEMFVIRAQNQRFEYVNCHRHTGMLNAVT